VIGSYTESDDTTALQIAPKNVDGMSHWQFLPGHDVSTDERKPDHDAQT
jgi:hypothetical protein